MKRRTTPLEELYARPGFLLRRAHQVNAAIFDEECGEFGVTPTQYGLLLAIASNEEIDVVGAARLTAIDRTSAHVAIGNLERRGWIRRRSDPRDRRRHLLTVTRAGWELMRASKPALARVKRRLLAKLSASDARAFRRILLRIVGEIAPQAETAVSARRALPAKRARSTASSRSRGSTP